MRDSRRSQKDLLQTCALQHKTLNQQKNSDKLLQVILYACNNLFINCSQYDLASTCFTQLQEKILKSSYFWLLQKPGLLQSTLLTGISSSRFRGQCHQRRGVLVASHMHQCICFAVGVLNRSFLERVVCIWLFKWRNFIL